MQPFEPELKERLKRAHPGLTDDDIEEVETMLSRRQDIAADRGRKEARRLDSEWGALVARKVPRLREIMLEYDREQIRNQWRKPKPAVEIKRKPPAR